MKERVKEGRIHASMFHPSPTPIEGRALRYQAAPIEGRAAPIEGRAMCI